MRKQMIIKTIKRIYLAKLIPAVFFLIFTVFLILKYPFQEILLPKRLDNINSIFDEYKSGQEFLEITVPTMYYTGYNDIRYSVNVGSYYYGFIDDTCVFFLINNPAEGQPEKELHNVTIKTKKINDSTKSDALMKQFANDLFWTETDLAKISTDFIISEPDSFVPQTYLVLLLLGIMDVYCVASILLSLIYIAAPYRSPMCRNLGKGKIARQELSAVVNELNAKREFNSSDILITQNYFIELSKYKVEIIPLHKIIWIFKHSTMSHFWGISYNLVIYSTHGKTKISNKQKFEADAILDYIGQNNPNILLGYSKENERLVKEQAKNWKIFLVNRLKEG